MEKNFKIYLVFAILVAAGAGSVLYYQDNKTAEFSLESSLTPGSNKVVDIKKPVSTKRDFSESRADLERKIEQLEASQANIRSILKQSHPVSTDALALKNIEFPLSPEQLKDQAEELPLNHVSLEEGVLENYSNVTGLTEAQIDQALNPN